jgi:PTH1 family peptidyl-tRNA hydrolase
MKVVAGLGNPGKEYAGTRHNIGFRVAARLAEKYNIDGKFESKFNALVGKGKIKGLDTIIVEPLTFMNLSGHAILKILNWYRVELPELIVVYDDIDINLGRIRFRPDGGPGGHNGVKSIIEQSGGKTNFPRLRVGIGPGPAGPERRNFVLKPFMSEQDKLVSDSINLAVEGLECYIKENIASAMNKYNGLDLTRPPKPKLKGKIFSDTSKVSFNEITLQAEYSDNICGNIFAIDILTLEKGISGGEKII